MKYQIETSVSNQIYNDIMYIAKTDIGWERMRNKTVLISGANGFIAYYLVLSCLLRNDLYHDNIKIVGMVRNKEKALKKYGDIEKREDFILVKQDVCQSIEVAEGNLTDHALVKHADFIIHAASQATPYYFENDPVGTLEANTTGTTNLLNYAVKERPEAVLMVSSLKVYGEISNGKDNIREEDSGYLDITSYKNCYAMGKRIMETLCSCYSKQYGVNVKIARPSYIYGASTLEDDRVWAQFLANIIKKEDILLKSNGASYRSFCYVADTVTALLTIMVKGEAAVPYNIAARHSNTTIRNFAKAAVKAFPDRNISLRFANEEDEREPVIENGRITPEILDSTRLEAIGWKGEIDLLEGIRRSVRTMEGK